MTTETKDNARDWAKTITALVAAMNADYDRLEELREARADLVASLSEIEEQPAAERDPDALSAAEDAVREWDEHYGDELRELAEIAEYEDGYPCKSQEDARERIEESALSVQVRGGWYIPGEAHDRIGEPEEFEILLTTGGPALRIRGELDEHCQPRRAWLEYQDWGTPWTEFLGPEAPSQDDLLAFASVFYFGE